MNMRIENGRPIFYGGPVNVKHTNVTGTEDVEIGGKTFRQAAGEKTQFTLSADQMNAIDWTIDDSANQPRWKQLENIKDMFYYGAGCSSKISEDIRSMKQSMANIADSFFDGEIAESELADKFQSLAEKFIGTCKEKQYPFTSLSGFDEAELSFAYDCFRGAILKSAAEHNNAEGKNSLYNFNSAVSGESDYIPGGLRAIEEKWIMDFDMVPPEGFKWFYEAEGRNEDVVMVEGDEVPSPRSTVWAMYEDMLISSSFDFSVGRDQPSDIKDLAELLQFRPAGRKELAAVNKFMKNFQVAPRWYYREQAQRETKERIQRAGWNVNA